MSENEEPTETLSTTIELPAEAKAELEVLCTRRGIYLRDFVQDLVHAALGVGATSPGRAEMARGGRAAHAMYDEAKRCAYGCGFLTASKSGLTQHENDCTGRSTGKTPARAMEGESQRRAAELRSSLSVATGTVDAASG